MQKNKKLEKTDKNSVQKAKKSYKKQKNLFWGVTCFALALLIVFAGQIKLSNTTSDTFGDGTYINGMAVKGYNVQKASQVLTNTIKEQIDGIKIQIMYKDKIWTFDQDDFEVEDSVKTVVQNAYDSYKLNQLSQTNSLNNAFKVSLQTTFKDFDKKIDQIVEQIEYDPQDAVVEFSPDNDEMFSIKEGTSGIKVDRDKLLTDLENQFLKTKDIKVYVTTSAISPSKDRSYFDNKLNLMSQFSTTLKDSQEGRRANVDLALKKFNGKVVKPSEQVSFNSVTSPQTKEGGYQPATVIYNGKFTTGIGGGICQASTTLYNALVLANLQIDEVHKHTLPVGYVELSLDAMVSEGYSDMVFTNNSDDDIYIKAYTTQDEAVVMIYGASIQDGVTIKRVAEFVGNIPHNGDKIVADENGEYADKVLYKGEYYRVKYPREGYEAKAYKETYKNGELISKEQIRHEKYQPIDGLIVEGVKQPPDDYTIPPTDVEFIQPQKTENSSVESVVKKIRNQNPPEFNP